MIATCKSCHSSFWRYRRDWPPPGFCSLPCHQVGPKPTAKPSIVPELPAVILRAMAAHRRWAHETESPLGWFDCRMCEELEADYAASLEWHYGAITTDIAEEANRRWATQNATGGAQ